MTQKEPSLLPTFAAVNERGCPFGAEIIPYEPDPVRAGGGIGFQILTVYPFFIMV